MRGKLGTSAMLLLLYALLIAALLVLVLSGAKLYAAAVAGQNTCSDQRRAASYIQSQASACEGCGIALRQGPEGDMLVLPDPAGGYETRIYLYGSALRSEYAAVGSVVDPAFSEQICSLSSFTAECRGDLLILTADGRQITVANRGGGSHD